MSAQSLRQKLVNRQTLLALGNTYPAPGVIEGMTKGWDAVWIDGQHGQYAYDSIAHALRTAEACQLETILRVPGHDPATLSAYADLAPAALMVPMVNTPEQATALVHAVHFAPKGARSYGGRRPIDLFGRNFFQTEIPLLIAQIETPEAARNAESIIAADGIDMLFFSADDFKLASNIPIETSPTDDQRLIHALEKTAKAASSANKYAGLVAATPTLAKLAQQLGYQLLVGGSDAGFLRTAATEKLHSLRTALKPT